MENILKFKFQMETINMLLNVLPKKRPKSLKEMYKYIVTAARIIFAAEWKLDACPHLDDLENKLAEYAVMANILLEKLVNFKILGEMKYVLCVLCKEINLE